MALLICCPAMPSLSLLLPAIIGTLHAEPLQVFVSPTGSDDASGLTAALAVRTPQIATARVRELRSHPENAGKPVRVILAEGTYTVRCLPENGEPSEATLEVLPARKDAGGGGY